MLPITEKQDYATLKQLKEGTIALKNDGTLEELEKVLQYAFPNDLHSSGKFPYYQAHEFLNRQWYPKLETNLPSHSVKEFLKPESEYPKVMKVSKSPIKTYKTTNRRNYRFKK